MTTIIRSGKYMIADHRTTSTSSKKVFDWTKAEYVSKTATDNVIKLMVYEGKGKVIMGDSYVSAIAFAGTAFAKELYAELVDTLKGSEIELLKLLRLMNKSLRHGDSFATAVAMSNTGLVLKIVLDDMGVRISERGKGDCLITAGSGGTIVKQIGSKVLTQKPTDKPKVEFHELFSLSCMFDKATSPTYSAYSLEENTLYNWISPKISTHRENVRKIFETMDLSKIYNLSLNTAS